MLFVINNNMFYKVFTFRIPKSGGVGLKQHLYDTGFITLEEYQNKQFQFKIQQMCATILSNVARLNDQLLEQYREEQYGELFELVDIETYIGIVKQEMIDIDKNMAFEIFMFNSYNFHELVWCVTSLIPFTHKFVNYCIDELKLDKLSKLSAFGDTFELNQRQFFDRSKVYSVDSRDKYDKFICICMSRNDNIAYQNNTGKIHINEKHWFFNWNRSVNDMLADERTRVVDNDTCFGRKCSDAIDISIPRPRVKKTKSGQNVKVVQQHVGHDVSQISSSSQEMKQVTDVKNEQDKSKKNTSIIEMKQMNTPAGNNIKNGQIMKMKIPDSIDITDVSLDDQNDDYGLDDETTENDNLIENDEKVNLFSRIYNRRPYNYSKV